MSDDYSMMVEEEFNNTELFIIEDLKIKECIEAAGNETVPDGWCPPTHDTILCWPPSPPGVVAQQSCLEDLHGVKYDTNENASKYCTATGEWTNFTNYTRCRELKYELLDNLSHHVEMTATVYLVGFTISLLALCIAVAIFLFYKDLRCLRNTIHMNLFSSYIFVSLFWILNYSLQMKADAASCTAIIILLLYFHLTNFFWMFVEGLYLYMLVVETFVRENMKLMGYLLIGWGLPAVVILNWCIAQIFIANDSNDSSGNKTTLPGDDDNCSWYNWSSTSEWIFQTPVLLILAINFVFLIRIMIVLITKLRSSTNVETQMNRKATKALFVLIPLLGVTYVLLIWGPDQPKSPSDPSNSVSGQTVLSFNAYIVYDVVRNVLISTQGFTVAMLYCFLNTEVRNAIRHHFQRWEDSRQIGRRLYKKCDHSNDGSRMSRKGKRESMTSDITTMTTVHSSRVSNGSVSGRHNTPDI